MHTYQNSFRQLLVWQEAKKLALEIYKLTKQFPKEELYAMVSQLRRAAYSILANIAEGNARKSNKDRLHFFNMAGGSLVEVDCFLELAKELKYINSADYDKTLEMLNKTAYLLNKFIKSQVSQSS